MTDTREGASQVQAAAFAMIADALREIAAPLYSVHVDTNAGRITLTERGYVGGNERDILVRVRRVT